MSTFGLLCFVIVNMAIAMIIPKYAYQYAKYKQEKRGKEFTGQITTSMRVVSVLSAVAYSLYAYMFLPLTSAVFASIFMMFAIFGVIVDHMIRIIGNEMVGIMLIVANIYRVMDGGFKSLLGSLLAIVCVIAYFALADLIVRLHHGQRGVGMGDVKLAMVIAVAVGFPGIYYFVIGMAIAVLYVVLSRILKNIYLWKQVFNPNNTFPMCGPIMVGLLFTIIQQPVIYHFNTYIAPILGMTI